MGKISELDMAISDLRKAAATINDVADTLAEMFNSAAVIEAQLALATVQSVFERYGAYGTWDLNLSYLPEVFSELYAIEVDLD